ncbi:ARPP-1 family domain-containing protein [Actinomadura sp. 9N215]|uniref:ARPP-1 family domain-containing protein n=1 Tax=Actinomadura sp. 9N215 TaxID=3375150 RepID=UPI0037A7936B
MTRLTALDTLLPGPLSVAGHRLGTPQQAGALTMVPISGPARPGFVPPRSGLKLSRVAGYGRVELANAAGSGVAIVPLHIGYVQDRAQNHALCRSAFLAPGQRLLFEDACCVQQSQGGYLAGRDQWFFVLPLELRARALELRGVHGYGKLWDDIAALNARHGLAPRGHLEQILSRERPVLTRFQSRLEPLPGQVGALFFVAGRFAGLEIAPDPAYFAEMWAALACFAYGVAARHAEPAPDPHADPFDTDRPGAPDGAAGLAGLRGALERDRAARLAEIAGWLADTPAGPADLHEEDRYPPAGQGLRLSTVTAPHLAGQIVTDGDRTVYASLFAR